MPASEPIVADRADSVAGVSTDEFAGWLLLLPAVAGSECLLVIETGAWRDAPVAVRWYRNVTSFVIESTDRLRIERYVDGRCSAVRTLPWQGGAALPFGDAEFAGCIWRRRASDPGYRYAIAELRRVVRPGGFCYVELANRWSFQKAGDLVRGSWHRLPQGENVRGWTTELRRQFAHTILSFPWTTDHEQLSELIPDHGYRPGRNAFQASARVKQLLLQGRRARVLASSVALIATDLHPPAALLAAIGRALSSPSVSRDVKPASFEAGRIVVTEGKAFVEWHRPNDPDGLLTVVPFDPVSITRRHTELAALAALRAAGFSIAALVPARSELVMCGDHPVFVYSLMAGTAVDAPVPELAELTARAIGVLVDFNRQSLHSEAIDAAGFERVFGLAVAGFRARYPACRQALADLVAQLSRLCLNLPLRLVWLHGDYKVENLLFDTKSQQVSGVIDWELACSDGLLLTDLLYLLAYNRVTRRVAPDVLIAIEAWLAAGYDASESRAVEDYARDFDLSPRERVLAMAAFVLQHAGQRFRYDPEDATITAQLTSILKTLTDALMVLPAGDAEPGA